MANIIINRKVLDKLLGRKVPLDQLKDRISMMDAVLEKAEGDELEVEVFACRPDMLSEQGFARALSSFLGIKTGLKEYKFSKSGNKVVADESLPKEWPYVVACIVKGLKFNDEKIREIIRIQEKLGVTVLRSRKKGGLGLYPLEKIHFPVRFEGRKPEEINFQPLEFPKVINGRQILSQHPTGRTYAHICQEWGKFPVFVDAQGTIMSMPPIINSHTMGKITESTTDVFIEATGTDLNALNICINILVTTLADMGGSIYSLEVTQKDGNKQSIPDLTPKKMKLDINYANQRLGLELKEKEAKELLEKQGFGYEKGIVSIPAYRADILHPVDLVEEIAIAYGYENFKPEIPQVSTIGEENPEEKLFRKVREILVGMSLLEARNLHLFTEADLNKKMGLSAKVVSLKNALGEFNCLRNSLLVGLLKDLSENQHNEYPQNLFEIGRVFDFNESTETGVEEKEKLAVVLCHPEMDYTQLRQVLDALMKNLGLEVTIKEAKHPSYIPGRVGRIIVGGKKIGFIGEIHPQVLTDWGLFMPVAGMELELGGLWGS